MNFLSLKTRQVCMWHKATLRRTLFGQFTRPHQLTVRWEVPSHGSQVAGLMHMVCVASLKVNFEKSCAAAGLVVNEE